MLTDLKARWKDYCETGDDAAAHRKLIGHCVIIALTMIVMVAVTMLGMAWGFTLTALPQLAQEVFDWIYKL